MTTPNGAGPARLERWAVYSPDDGYTPPELRVLMLVGDVYGHPRKKPDGKTIRTSRITGADGRRVSTSSGTVYVLGEPHPDYRAWLREHRPEWDAENPIKMMGVAS